MIQSFSAVHNGPHKTCCNISTAYKNTDTFAKLAELTIASEIFISYYGIVSSAIPKQAFTHKYKLVPSNK